MKVILCKKNNNYAIRYIYLNVIGYQHIKQDNSNAIIINLCKWTSGPYLLKTKNAKFFN